MILLLGVLHHPQCRLYQWLCCPHLLLSLPTHAPLGKRMCKQPERCVMCAGKYTVLVVEPTIEACSLGGVLTCCEVCFLYYH